MREQIIKQSKNLFFKFGIKSVSMDEIASTLGISKKTLYQHFNNKSELLKKIIEDKIEVIQKKNTIIINEEGDAIDKILKIYYIILVKSKNFNPVFIHDLHKYYSSEHQLIKDFKKTELQYLLTELITLGKKQKIFRKDIDEDLIYYLHMQRIDSMANGTISTNKKFDDPVFCFNILLNNIIGLTTLEGHELIENKIKNLKKINIEFQKQILNDED